MKLLSTAFAAFALLAATVNGSSMLRMEAEGKSNGKTGLEQAQQQTQQQTQQQAQKSSSSSSSCNLTGTYKSGTDISSCSSITIGSLSVPAGVTLDLSGAKSGATITFTGTTTFGTQKWEGPLVLLGGSNLSVKGSGTLDGQGAWYWKQGQSITRPVFFRLLNVVGSKLSGFTLKNSPYRTFSIVNSKQTTISGLTLDSRAGNGLAKNTDGFDLTKNDAVSITGNKIYNQDDCLAMQSSTNTVFSNNYCCGGHGISIGSLGGTAVDESDTVSGLTVSGNTIVDSVNGIRIKTIIGLKGLVSNIKYSNNKLSNVENAIVIHSDYSKSEGGYTGSPTSAVTIQNVAISGLTGSATNLYDIVANPKVVSGWSFSGVTVSATSTGSCSGQPSNVDC
ncbi:endopolygalacturonase 2 [Phytophthora cinnamomi]|uniref:endopolygalacturonase 2 n=2 Tax=Phytophthora cinnamomi TaxID=4785 RepID=UPI00355A682F|nr:endopolygalacturonase 2 [Phytophthora cinnamomi]UKP15060.1 polygalacturonase [Phytophthora cinnamomi]